MSFMCSVCLLHIALSSDSECSAEFRKTILLNMYFIINYFSEVVNWKVSQQRRDFSTADWHSNYLFSMLNANGRRNGHVPNIFVLREYSVFVSLMREISCQLNRQSQSIVNLWKQLKRWKVLEQHRRNIKIWNDNGSMKLNLITIHSIGS